MSIKRFKVLYDDTAAGTGDWIRLDNRYDDGSEIRSLIVKLTAGDTATLQATAKDVRGGDGSFVDDLLAKEIATLTIYTGDTNDLLEGPWTHIRVIKTGTAGNCYVAGYV